MSLSGFIFFLLAAIVSGWSFGAWMKTVGTRNHWNLTSTFWGSAILYIVLGFVTPFILLTFSYSDSYFGWMFIFIGATPIWLLTNLIVKRQENQKSQTAKPLKKDDQPAALPPRANIEKQVTPQPVHPSDSSSRKGSWNPLRKGVDSHIFVSYRRADSADISGRIYDRLVAKFGREAVFKDVDSIPLGIDFKAYLDEQVSKCTVQLVIIGDRWLDARDADGNKRLDDPADFVRIEIESALERDIPVIPLLVRGASMPAEASLPVSLRKLVYRNGIPIRPDPDFHRDMDRLIAGLEKTVK